MAYMLKEQKLQFDLRVSPSWVDVTPDQCRHFYSELHMHHIFDIELSVKVIKFCHFYLHHVVLITLPLYLTYMQHTGNL